MTKNRDCVVAVEGIEARMKWVKSEDDRHYFSLEIRAEISEQSIRVSFLSYLTESVQIISHSITEGGGVSCDIITRTPVHYYCQVMALASMLANEN